MRGASAVLGARGWGGKEVSCWGCWGWAGQRCWGGERASLVLGVGMMGVSAVLGAGGGTLWGHGYVHLWPWGRLHRGVSTSQPGTGTSAGRGMGGAEEPGQQGRSPSLSPAASPLHVTLGSVTPPQSFHTRNTLVCSVLWGVTGPGAQGASISRGGGGAPAAGSAWIGGRTGGPEAGILAGQEGPAGAEVTRFRAAAVCGGEMRNQIPPWLWAQSFKCNTQPPSLPAKCRTSWWWTAPGTRERRCLSAHLGPLPAH